MSGNESYILPAALRKQLTDAVADWTHHDKVSRLWQRDASLWTNSDEAEWLGWLDIVEKQLADTRTFEKLSEDIRQQNFSDILLLGMGGSSLCPEVLEKTYGRIDGFPRLRVLDSTDPQQIKAFEDSIDLQRTLFIVSSKSGSTLEPNIFKKYFFEGTKQTVGPEKAGSRWIAITDPGSKLEAEAQADHFRHIFHGVPSIGGRYSALSNFGIVPAAAMGLNVSKLLSQAQRMVKACALDVSENPGVMLGLILGSAAKIGLSAGLA